MQKINYGELMKFQIEHEKKKKEELLNSTFFKILEKDNKKEYILLMNYLKDKNIDEIEAVIKYFISKKSVQKINNY